MATGTSADAATSDRGALSIRSLATRVSWGLGDQAVSSLTNLMVGLVVARSLGVVEFGIFALAWATYGAIINVSRGIASDPFVVRHSGVPVPAWRTALSQATGAALLVGIATCALLLGVGLVMGGPLGTAFVALGAIMPFLLVQDVWRFGFFAAGRGAQACLNDAIWAMALVPALLLAGGHGSVVAFILAWGGAAGVAAVAGCVQARTIPRPQRVRSWLHDHRDLGPRYVLENISNSGASQLRTYGLGVITGLVAVGAVRGAELLLAPFLAVLMGLSLVAVPEAARVARARPERLARFCLLIGGVQAFAALAWGLGLKILIPDAVGVQLLGDVWPSASALILPATFAAAFAGLASGAATGLRARGAARRSLHAQLISSAAYITGGLGGAFIGGAFGSSSGVALGLLLGSIGWWRQLRAELQVDLPTETAAATHETKEHL